MHLYLHKTLLSLLICCLAGQALHADNASATPVKADINQARIADGNFRFPGIIASDPASVASLTRQAASIAAEIPVQEIPAIDNLLQIAGQSQPQINNLAKPVIKAITGVTPAGQSAKKMSEPLVSGGLALKSAIDSELSRIPGVATLAAVVTGAIASAILPETAAGTTGSPVTASAGVALTASATAGAKPKKDSEYIDTLFPDPLSPDFPSESGISEAEKNRPAKEVIDEINQKAEEIAERTAKELGIEYIPPSVRLSKTEPGEPEQSGGSTASAGEDLAPETSEIASGEAKVETEADSGSWEYPGDTRASTTAEVKKPQMARPDPRGQNSSAVKENEITEEPETDTAPGTEPAKTSDRSSSTKPAVSAGEAENGRSARTGKLPEPAEPVKPGKQIESNVTADDGTASGSENIGGEIALEETSPASETVVTDTENEIIPVQWPDSPEDPEFASGSQQLFSDNTASATRSGGELPGLFEKAEALAPALMTRGKPEDELSDVDEIKKITGRLVPEKQPLGRRRHLYRWVLKTDDGGRIPLKSNLKLLTEVRNEKMLDGKVNLSGRFIKSGMHEELQYFVVESATFADASTASGSVVIKIVKTSGAADKSKGRRVSQPVKAKDEATQPMQPGQPLKTGKSSQPAGAKNAASGPAKSNSEADKIDFNHKSGSSGTKNAAKKQGLPSGDRNLKNLKQAPLPEQP